MKLSKLSKSLAASALLLSSAPALGQEDSFSSQTLAPKKAPAPKAAIEPNLLELGIKPDGLKNLPAADRIVGRTNWAKVFDVLVKDNPQLGLKDAVLFHSYPGLAKLTPDDLKKAGIKTENLKEKIKSRAYMDLFQEKGNALMTAFKESAGLSLVSVYGYELCTPNGKCKDFSETDASEVLFVNAIEGYYGQRTIRVKQGNHYIKTGVVIRTPDTFSLEKNFEDMTGFSRTIMKSVSVRPELVEAAIILHELGHSLIKRYFEVFKDDPSLYGTAHELGAEVISYGGLNYLYPDVPKQDVERAIAYVMNLRNVNSMNECMNIDEDAHPHFSGLIFDKPSDLKTQKVTKQRLLDLLGVTIVMCMNLGEKIQHTSDSNAARRYVEAAKALKSEYEKMDATEEAIVQLKADGAQMLPVYMNAIRSVAKVP